MKRSARAKSVDDYLNMVPEDTRVALEKLRKIIKAAAPVTTEVVSYKIPIFKVPRTPSSRVRGNGEPLLVLHHEFKHDSQTRTRKKYRAQGIRC